MLVQLNKCVMCGSDLQRGHSGDVVCLRRFCLNITHARGGIAEKKIVHLAKCSQLIHPGPASSRPRFLESSQSCLVY